MLGSMDEREARCALLAKVLAADGIMTDHERAFLEEAMTQQGLDDAQRRRVRDLDGWNEAAAVMATLELAQKRAFMDSLLDAVLADGKISEHERATIQELAAALGLA